jgi:DNA topoisomerase-3
MWEVFKKEVKVEKKKVTGIATEVCPKCKRDPNKVSQPTAVATIKQDVILYCLTLTQKNIREPIHDYSKGSTVNLKDFKTDLGTVFYSVLMKTSN